MRQSFLLWEFQSIVLLHIDKKRRKLGDSMKNGGFIGWLNRYNYENPKFHRGIQCFLESLQEIKRILN